MDQNVTVYFEVSAIDNSKASLSGFAFVAVDDSPLQYSGTDDRLGTNFRNVPKIVYLLIIFNGIDKLTIES